MLPAAVEPLLLTDAPEERVTVTPEAVFVTPVWLLLTEVSLLPPDFAADAEADGLPDTLRVILPEEVRVNPVFLAPEEDALPLADAIPVLFLWP